MKQLALRLLTLIIVAAFIAGIIPQTREELLWVWVQYKDDSDGYATYLRSWPNGKYVSESLESYAKFVLAVSPSTEADPDWRQAATEHTPRSYLLYSNILSGRHVSYAKEMVAWFAKHPEIATFRDVRSLKLIIQESYGKADQVKLPWAHEIAPHLRNLARLS